MFLLLLWVAARGAQGAWAADGKDTYLDAFMESHASLTANSANSVSAQQQSPQYPYSNPQPQYNAPSPTPQYGSPSPQYGTPYPQPQYGPPTTFQPTSAPVPFFEGLGAGLLSLLQQLPLPDLHTTLKILLKVVFIKGVVKIISLLLVMLFIPKLEDILTIVSNIMEMDKEKPSMMSMHHHDDDDQMSEDNATEDAMMSGESGRAGGAHGLARSRVMNALAARVEEAISRVAKSLDVSQSERGSAGWPRTESSPKKAKKKTVNKKTE